MADLESNFAVAILGMTTVCVVLISYSSQRSSEHIVMFQLLLMSPFYDVNHDYNIGLHKEPA